MTTHVSLDITPSARVDLIDLRARLGDASAAHMSGYPRILLCSHHTTAGFLEQSLCGRLRDSRDAVSTFIGAFQRLFPPDAPYHHDDLEQRTELSESQRRVEPRNADSHLTFIGSGLRSCVTYANEPERPVFFIDLDGVCDGRPRTRTATVIGYHREELVESFDVNVPVSTHGIDSINLRDPRLGLFEMLEARLTDHGVGAGRVDVSLPIEERHAALTVNEYETLLMKHDLAEVLRNPVRYVAQKSRHIVGGLKDPRVLQSKMLSYAKYDLVQLLNETMDAFGVSESLLERLVDRFLAVPTSRCLRMKRGVSLAVTEHSERGGARIVQGRYQSPILVQWDTVSSQTRRLSISLVRFA